MPLPTDLQVEVTIDAEVSLPAGLDIPVLTSLVRHVLRAEDQTGEWQVGIRFVDDPTMQRAHVEFMGIDSPTDIMTFPYEVDEFGFDFDFEFDMDAGPGNGEQGGDLLISVDRAADHAGDAGWDTRQEILFVVIHGVLHILGWDDLTEDDRAAMLARQHVLLHEWMKESPKPGVSP